jgi:methylmalonyl-CoA mutase N-terminal domain/subunit
VQREIMESAYRAQKAVDAGDAIVVGVNRYASDQPAPLPVFTLDPSVEREQTERVRAVRASRSRQACESALDAVTRAARTGDNLMPWVVNAVEQHATLGEIADALRLVFGEYQDTSVG